MSQTEETTFVRARQPLTVADLRSHMMQIESGWGDNKKKSDYLPVQGRILWFHGEVSRYKIKTEKIVLDFAMPFTKEKSVWENSTRKKVSVTANGVATFKATIIIYDPTTGEVQIEVDAHKTETCVDFPDFQEKAETGAVGRALALAGYGTKFALELREDDRVVDSPQTGTRPVTQSTTSNKPTETASLSSLIHGDLKKKVEPVMQAYARSQGSTLTQTWWPDVLKEIFGEPLPNHWTQEHVEKIKAYREGVIKLVREATQAIA